MSLRKTDSSDQLNISLLESYKRRRIAISQMPELPPSPPPPQFGDLTPSEFEEDRTHRIGYLRGRVTKAFTAANGNPADGRWGALSDILSLSCTAGRDGRWIGLRLDPAPEDEEEDEVLDQLGVVLARTEEEWKAWEDRYEKRMNVRRRVGEWTKGITAESPPSPLNSKPRRKSPLHVVVSAEELEAEKDVEAEVEGVPTVAPSTTKAKSRVARMSTGGKSPKRSKAQEEQVATTGKVINVVSTTVPDALKNSAPFGYGVVKRPTVKVKEKAKDNPKKSQELKKKQERVEWEQARERKLRETREKEAEKARQDKEREEAERRRQQEPGEEVVVDKSQDRRMQIQDVSEMSFIPPSFPSSVIMHSTPKPPVRPTKPFTRRNTSPSVPRLEETHDKAVEIPPPAAEESSYSFGISMVTSADLPSQILVPPTTTKKRSRPVSPTPSPVVRDARPEKRARNDDVRDASPARVPQQEPVEQSSEIEISFIPPSFPPGGIVTSTPKPPSKSSLPEKDKAVNPKQREVTPPVEASLPTRPFLLPPTPKNRPLEASSSLPAISSQPSPLCSSPTNKIRQSSKRPASPNTPIRENTLKKARTMPAVSLTSPPSSPTRLSPGKAKKTPDSWLRSPSSKRSQNTSAEDLIVARTTLLNVRHVLAGQQPIIPQDKQLLVENRDTGVDMGSELPVTPQKKRNPLPTLTDLLASSTRSRKGKGSASAKKLKKTLIVRTPSGERVDVIAMRTLKSKVQARDQAKEVDTNGFQELTSGKAGEELRASQETQEQEESVKDNAEPSTIGTGLENYQQLKAAANASADIFLDDSDPPHSRSNTDNALPESPPATDSPPPAEATDPYSDAYHFAEDIVVPTGSKLRTFPGAGGSYPFANGRGSVDPYADNPYDDPYSSAGEHVGISPTKSLSSLAGSDSDSDDAADDSDDGLGRTHPLRRTTANGAFNSSVLSAGFVFDPCAASTQVPPGLNFGVGTGGPSSLFSVATSGARSVPTVEVAQVVEGAKQPLSQESKDSWASMYVSSVPAEHGSSALPPSSGGDPTKDPSPHYALPEALQPAPSSSSPMRAEQGSSPVQAPPSSNPFFTFSSQAFGGNLAKHVDMVSRLLDKDVDFGGWLKDPEEIEEPPRGVEESP